MKPWLDHITPLIALAVVGLVPLLITTVAVTFVVIMAFVVPTQGNRKHSLDMVEHLTEYARVVRERP